MKNWILGVVAISTACAFAEEQDCAKKSFSSSKCTHSSVTARASVSTRRAPAAKPTGAREVLWAEVDGTANVCPLVFVACGTALTDAGCLEGQTKKVKLQIKTSRGSEVFVTSTKIVERVKGGRESTALITFPAGACELLKAEVRQTEFCARTAVEKLYAEHSDVMSHNNRFQIPTASGAFVDLAPAKYLSGHRLASADAMAFRGIATVKHWGGLPLFMKTQSGKAFTKCLVGFNVGTRKIGEDDEWNVAGKRVHEIVGFSSVRHLEDLQRHSKSNGRKFDLATNEDYDDDED